MHSVQGGMVFVNIVTAGRQAVCVPAVGSDNIWKVLLTAVLFKSFGLYEVWQCTLCQENNYQNELQTAEINWKL